MTLKQVCQSSFSYALVFVTIVLVLAWFVADRIVEKRRAWEAWIQTECGSDIVLEVRHYGAFASSPCYKILCGNPTEKTQHEHIKCE